MIKRPRDILDDALHLRILKMRDQKRWTMQHIARRTGLSVGTVYNIINRFRFGRKPVKGIRKRRIRLLSLSDVFEI